MNTGLSALTTRRGDMIYFPSEMKTEKIEQQPELRINFMDLLPYTGMQKEVWRKITNSSEISGVILDDVSVMEWATVERKNQVKVFIGYVLVPWKREIKAINDPNSLEKYNITLSLVGYCEKRNCIIKKNFLIISF
jgi:hypothetical protein